MGNRFERFLDSNCALKLYIFICIISILAIIPLSFLSSFVIIVIGSLYFLSGILLNKRDVSLISIFVFVYIIGVLNLLILNTSNGVLGQISNILYLIFYDPLQIINLLPHNAIISLILVLIIPIFPVALMYTGMKVFESNNLSARLDKLKAKGRFFKQAIYIILPVLLIVNIYFIYNPKLSVRYYNSVPIDESFKAELTIDEKGNYNYLKTSYNSGDVREKINLKLTKKELRELAFNVIYMNAYFKLMPDLSVNDHREDQQIENLRIKWFGKTKVVSGYDIENLQFKKITSILEEKIKYKMK